MEIKDSGTRRKFESGAVRDVGEGKGRCDLLPLEVLSNLFEDRIFDYINDYVRSGDLIALKCVIEIFTRRRYETLGTAMLEVSKHFEDGANKYAERNWELGINSHCYIDSAVRHYLKYKRGDNDEAHDRAFLWNIMCAWWTHMNKPEMIDLPFYTKKSDTKAHKPFEKCEHMRWFGDLNTYECDKFGIVCNDFTNCKERTICE